MRVTRNVDIRGMTLARIFLFFSLWCFSFLLYLAFPSFIPGGVMFLIPVSIQAAWMLRLSLKPRLVVAVCTGVLFDAVGSMPYGTHLVSFFLMVLITELLVAFISNSDSAMAQMLMSVAMILVFVACMGLVSVFLA